MAWRSNDKRLLPRDAAGRFAGEAFEDREVLASSFRGQWATNGKLGAWTFKLKGGNQVYRLEWTGAEWRVTADIMT